jgi:hypothetical protein
LPHEGDGMVRVRINGKTISYPNTNSFQVNNKDHLIIVDDAGVFIAIYASGVWEFVELDEDKA